MNAPLPKPAAVPPSELPEEVKKKLAEKAKSLPGYRTKICNNYENEGMCQYDDMCHYAHGKELKLKYPRLEELLLSNYAYVFVKCIFLGVKQKSNNKFKFKKYLTKCCSQSQNRFSVCTIVL